MNRKPRKFKCPKCGEVKGVRLIFGFPDEEAFALADKEHIALGGCVIPFGPDPMPNRQCIECGHQWKSGIKNLCVPVSE